MLNFVGDLGYGQEAEEKLKELLLLRNSGARFTDSDKAKEFDFSMELPDGSVTSFEVKRDRMAPRTGNVAIEMSYKDRPSGIKCTTADFMVYMIGEKFYRIPPVRLLKAIHENKAGRFVRGGDNNDSLMWLMPVRYFTEVAELVI